MPRLTLKITPNARRNEILGWDAPEKTGNPPVLRVKLRVPPVEGRANREVVAFLADCLGLPKSAVVLVHGAKSRSKVVEITGLSEAEVHARLGEGEDLSGESQGKSAH